jgi:hypothetical protein
MKILAPGSMKQNKLRGQLETVHAECVGETTDCFHRRPNEFNKQKHMFAKITTVISKPLLASFKVAYRVAKRK